MKVTPSAPVFGATGVGGSGSSPDEEPELSAEDEGVEGVVGGIVFHRSVPFSVLMPEDQLIVSASTR